MIKADSKRWERIVMTHTERCVIFFLAVFFSFFIALTGSPFTYAAESAVDVSSPAITESKPKILLVKKQTSDPELLPSSSASKVSDAGNSDVQNQSKLIESFKSKEPEVKRSMENIGGEVVRIDGNMISVLYSRTENAEYELALPLDEKAEFSGYKKAADIKVGDQVELAYEKAITAPGAPDEKREMVVKKIRFIRRPDQDISLHSSGGGQ